MIKAKGKTPSIVSAFNPQRIFLLDTHTNNVGFVDASCRGVCTQRGGGAAPTAKSSGRGNRSKEREALRKFPSSQEGWCNS